MYLAHTRPLALMSATPGQSIQFEIYTWRANEQLKCNEFKTKLLMFPHPKPSSSVVFPCLLWATADFQFPEMEF